MRRGSIHKLVMGETTEILCFDRNFGDTLYHIASRRTSRSPRVVLLRLRDVLRKGAVVLRHQHVHGLAGLALETSEGIDKWFGGFPLFDVEYAPDNYFPLVNGRLPGCPRKTARVGWCGPAVLLKDLDARFSLS